MTLPEEIPHVSQTQFSIARHYGGISYQGVHYTYDPTRDVLIRDDVLKRRRQQPEARRQQPEQESKEANGELF